MLPAITVGGALWYFAGTLPGCKAEFAERLRSPDGRFDLIVFSRTCGASTGTNTQAALIPAGEGLPDDAASFFSVGTEAELAPRWDGFGNIELTLPEQGQIYRRDDAVAGVAVIYR